MTMNAPSRGTPESVSFRPSADPARGGGVFSPMTVLPDPAAPRCFRSVATGELAPMRPVQVPPAPRPPEPPEPVATGLPPSPAVPAAPARPAVPPPPRPVMTVPALSAADIERARAEGRAEAEAAFAAERGGLRQAVQALAAALDRLDHPDTAQIERLARTLDAAVASLAAERAGQAIDADPAPFAARIAELAGRAAHGLSGVVVHLHPDDLARVAPLLDQAVPAHLSALAAARLIADPGLSRGDADIRAPGVRIADCLQAAAGGLS